MMRSKPTDNDGRPVEDVSVSRRHLLKAAATTAPLIATLPSGAALANASTQACLAKEVERTTTGDVPPDVDFPNSDTYVHVLGVEAIYSDGSGSSFTIYYFNLDGPFRPGSVGDLALADVSVDSDGNWVDPPDPTQYSITQIERRFLRIYQPNADLTDVQEQCTLRAATASWPASAPDPQSPEYCIAPIATPGEGSPINIANPTSCYCSINPTADGCTL
jgi:hypothetical protein